MNHLYKLSICLLLLFIQLNSCNSDHHLPDSTKTPAAETEVIIDTNGILPTPIENKNVTKEESMAMVAKLSGLGDIKNKATQEEIRIWFGYALSDSIKIVVIKNDQNNWHSSAYYLQLKIDKHNNIISIHKKVEKHTPISGWKNFLKSLVDLNIYKLKDYRQLPDYFDCADGDQLSIEIWKNSAYHICDFPCFDTDGNKYIKEVKKICFLVQKEFGYSLFPLSQ